MPRHFDIPVGEHRVKASLESPNNSDGSILWLLGRGAARLDSLKDRERQANLFKKDMLTFDYSGSGESEGDFSQKHISDHLEEAKAALDWIARELSGSTTVIGASYGGYLGAVLASETKTPIDNLILRAPALFPPEELQYKWGELELRIPQLTVDYRQNVDQMKNNPTLNKLARFAGRILIIEHGRDEVMPANVIKAYRDSLPNAEYYLAPDVPHAITEAPKDARDAYENYIARWLNS